MSQNRMRGFLVVGDISGYTSYVATTELEHAQQVLAELLELIVARFQPMLSIVRLEGDAVFAHAPVEQIPRAESLIELIESTYTAFRDHVRGIVHRTTCECKACRAIPLLDLKFVVHFGDYMIQQVANIRELVGTEVNRLFRLTKNSITRETGWNAYVAYTAASLELIGVEPDGMRQLQESHQHLGEVTIFVADLHARYEQIAAARYVVLSADEAHGTVSVDIAAPQAIVWEWLNDPVRRNQASPSVTWSIASRPGGRTGVGASNHCAHGKNGLICETILDWRPFDYVTTRSTSAKLPDKLFDSMVTVRLEPLHEGEMTRVTWTIKMERLPGLIARGLANGYLKQLRAGFLEPVTRLIMADKERREARAMEMELAADVLVAAA
jgi:hypothetical protein